MLEIAPIILSSLAGVATAAAVKKMPRDKNQLLSLGASSHIKNQISSLNIEKDILTKTISRLYQADTEFSKIQKDKLLLKYQHQLGIVLAKLEKLDQASKHPDLGPVGDGLITLMDQKLSKLDDRLHELSSKITLDKVEPKQTENKKEPKQTENDPFKAFEKSRKAEPVIIPPTKSRQSFELTTLTNVPRDEPEFPSITPVNPKVSEPMPQPRVYQPELTPKPQPKAETKPDITKEFKKITEHKALPEPNNEKAKAFDDDFDDDGDDLDKIKNDIMKVLSKLDQAEVE